MIFLENVTLCLRDLLKNHASHRTFPHLFRDA